MPIAATLDVFLDGSCSYCRWMRSKVEPYDSVAQLRFLDYNDPLVAARAPFSSSELAREMHVQLPDGSWAKGFDAWLAVLGVLPKLAWIGRLAGLPPVRWLGPSLYRFIASHRYSLPGAPTRCATDTCALPAHHPK